jgi:hypothetical protein
MSQHRNKEHLNVYVLWEIHAQREKDKEKAVGKFVGRMMVEMLRNCS